MGAYYWYVKIPQCMYMEYGLKDFAFDVKKHIAHRAVCYNLPLVHNKLLGVPAHVRLIYWASTWTRKDLVLCYHISLGHNWPSWWKKMPVAFENTLFWIFWAVFIDNIFWYVETIPGLAVDNRKSAHNCWATCVTYRGDQRAVSI